MWEFVDVTDVETGEDVCVDAADVLDSLGFNSLSEWCAENDLTVLPTWEYENLSNMVGFICLEENYTKQGLYKFLCDLTSSGYYIGKEELLNKLSEMFESYEV